MVGQPDRPGLARITEPRGSSTKESWDSYFPTISRQSRTTQAIKCACYLPPPPLGITLDEHGQIRATEAKKYPDRIERVSSGPCYANIEDYLGARL
ncbi:hypothetical protein CHU98_g5582 [Xylaria longipes]|nr:hypothetical protein CHU98_g5582 [Xylaria longipes]